MADVIQFPSEDRELHEALDRIFAEVRELRALIEQFVDRPPSVREWLSVDQAAVLLHRTPQACVFVAATGSVSKLPVNGG
jgi:hypothetical protein